MKLLLTAFDPFGGDKVNPALEAVKLVSEKVGNVEVTKVEVPTVFRKSIATVAAAIAKEKPDAVLCIGQAGGRYDITPERVAINLDDARISRLMCQSTKTVLRPIFLIFRSRLWCSTSVRQAFRPASPTQPEPLSAIT